ncbi:MAG: SDR family NAD(P)-dependent oxidoreductase [Cyanobacteria bacterium J06642_3]
MVKSPQANYFNNLVKNTVLEILKAKPENHQLKILEIGAGTGSTTAYLLPELVAKNIEYTFSDISALFLTQAREKFADYDFVDYQILDIEQEPILSEYDLIIAVNVIHATENLAATTSNIQQLLKPQGLFLLVEGTRPLYWVDLIFGLTEGWWKFKDSDLRKNHPLITAKQWESLLQKQGFERIVTINDDADSQGVILSSGRSSKESDVCLVIGNKFHNRGFEPEQNYNFISFSDRFQQVNETEFTINPESSQDIERLLIEIPQKHSKIEKIIYFCNSARLNLDNINAVAKQITNPILKLVQSLVKNNLSLDRLVLVTQGAVSTGQERQTTGLIQSVVWGIGKAIALEHPELNCTRIDLDPDIKLENQLENLLAEITNSREAEIAFRDNNRYLPRLSRYDLPQLLNSNNQPSYLTIDNSGSLDNLALKPQSRLQPNPNQIEIQIEATGLNFRDVLIALNLYPGEKTLGCECAGTVITVGDKITDLTIGDRVMAIASNTFGHYVTVERPLVAKVPDYMSFTDAATIPVTFLTAYYALCHLGKMAQGKRVLIHSAAGGVGQAAIQLAQQAGAEILATASQGKWDYLQSLGVKHIMNSRNLDFVSEINQITKGSGIDLVLNSLSGEFIPASLSVLKADGCFLEIGKLDIWQASQVQQQLPDAKYHMIDMVELCQQQPELIQSMLSELIAKFSDRQLQPLAKKVFPLPQALSAFRYLQQAKHIGKVVITPELSLDENGSYLIAGGLGGLGIITAHWLAKKGARNLILLGRSKPSESAQEEIEKLKQQGVTVKVIQTDISNYNSLKQTFTSHNLISSSAPLPLRGVINAAGLLDDSAIQNMTWEQVERVFQPKVTGAWNLHNLTKEINLDFFMLFSSAVSLLGSPGQANHVAANTFLDSLAHYRHSLGLPAMSINWGTWSNIGAAAQKQADTRMSQIGVNAIAPEPGIAILEQLFLSSFSSQERSNPTQVGVVNIDWAKFLQQGKFTPFFNEFKQAATQPKVDWVDLQAELERATATERRSLLLNHLRLELSRVLGFPATELDTKAGFFDLGMDSLTAIEFKNRLQDTIGFTLPSTVAFDYPNLEALADFVLDKMFPEDNDQDREEDIANLLAAELAAMEQDRS